jgi:hypothetical protein
MMHSNRLTVAPGGHSRIGHGFIHGAIVAVCLLWHGQCGAASLQFVEAWRNGVSLPSSTGQITSDQECAEIVAHNFNTAPSFGYAVDLDAGTFRDDASAIAIKQSCVPAEPFYTNPAHPFSGEIPRLAPRPCPPVGPGTEVWFIYGQSNAGNFGQGRYTARAHAYAYAGNGECYQLGDPVAGAEGSDAGPWARLADLMEGQTALDGVPIDRIIAINRAVGGSRLEDWAPGGSSNDRLVSSIRDAIAHGFSPTRIFQHQGEANAGPDVTEAGYRSAFAATSKSIRQAGSRAPIWVAIASICNYRTMEYPSLPDVLWREPDFYITKESNRATVRSAQSSLANGVDVRAGPNTDLIDWRKRASGDGCHFGEAGLIEHAQRWFDALTGN